MASTVTVASLALLLVAPPALAQGSVIVVDDAPGPPADFDDVQDAVDAAADGDVVLVRPGIYTGFTVDGKALRVLGIEEGGERPRLFGFGSSLRVQNLAAGQETTVRGFDVDVFTNLQNNLGDVVLEDLTGQGSVGITNSDSVLLIRNESYGIAVTNSTVHAWELDVEGAPSSGEDGIRLTDSFLFLSGSTVDGADGVPGSSGSFGFPFCGNGGAGGDGIQLVNSTCQAIDCVFDGGSGGPPGIPKIGPPCSAGPPGSDVNGPGLQTIAGNAHELEISSPGFETGTVELRLKGEPGEFAYVLLAPTLAPVFFPPWFGSLAVPPTSTLLFLGVLGPTGQANVNVTVGELGAGIEALRLVLQGVFVHLTGPDFIGSATDVELLDRDVLLVDCNGNGIDDAFDISSGFSLDTNGNGQPDECDVILIVPDQFPNILNAVTNANHKDVILVRDGTYSGFGSTGIDLNGKDLVIMSENGPATTAIDLATSNLWAFRLEDNPDTTRIQGFTFRNSLGSQAPILLLDSGGVIADCVFDNNHVTGGWPGGIAVFGGLSPKHDVRIEKCVFTDNSGVSDGGALLLNPVDAEDFDVLITNCVFDGNQTGDEGGAIYSNRTDVEIRNSVFVNNAATFGAAIRFLSPSIQQTLDVTGCSFSGNATSSSGSAAVTVYGQSVGSTAQATFRNSTFWDNPVAGGPGEELQGLFNVAGTISYTTIEGGLAGFSGPFTPGAGILAADPLFVNPAAGDLHLGPGSPCRDAGDPAFVALPGETDIDGEARVFGPAVDQGADEDQP